MLSTKNLDDENIINDNVNLNSDSLTIAMPFFL